MFSQFSFIHDNLSCVCLIRLDNRFRKQKFDDIVKTLRQTVNYKNLQLQTLKFNFYII